MFCPRRPIRGIAAGLPVLALLLGGPAAHATNVFFLEGYGAQSRAMGGTGYAFDIGSGALMTNPATIGLGAPGTRFDLGFELVNTDPLNATNRATGEVAHSSMDSFGHAAYAPHFGVVKRWDALTLAAGSFVQGGLGSEYGRDSFLSRLPSGVDTGLEVSSRLAVLRFPMAASYRVTEDLILAADLDLLYVGMNLQALLGADQIGFLAARGDVGGTLLPTLGAITGATGGAHIRFEKGNDLANGVQGAGIGGKIGAVWLVDPATTLGVVFHSPTALTNLRGRATMTALSPAGARVQLNGQVKIVDFDIPPQFGVGLAHAFSNRFMVAADVSRVFWSDTFQGIRLKFADGAGAGNLDVKLAQQLKDISIFAMGAQYRATDDLALRLGFRIGASGVRRSEEFPYAPYHLGKNISGGFSYTLGQASEIDFAYSHVFGQRVTSDGPPNTSFAAPIAIDHQQDNLILTLVYRP